MSKIVLNEDDKKVIKEYLEENPSEELVSTYLFYVQNKFRLSPVLCLQNKTIYQSGEDAIAKLEKDGKVWREAEIKITFGTPSVNEQTRKVYICPFTGKVFGDNTHPNPQDAIYDWVSKCPENTERVGGLKVKRFYVSEDPEVIQQYLKKSEPMKEPIAKVVYSSAASGKLFNSKKNVIEDFKKSYLKSIPLIDVPNQNRFEIEEELVNFIQDQLVEEKIASFVEALTDDQELTPFVEKWVGG